MKITRRTFLAGAAISPLICTAFKLPGDDNIETRTVFNSITGEALPGVKIIVKRLGGRGRFVFRTDENGQYPFGEIVVSTTAPTVFRLRIPPATLKNKFAAIDLALVVAPLARKNVSVGNFGLLPLQSPGPELGLTNEYFNNSWLDLVKTTLFAQDFGKAGLKKGLLPGAVLRFSSSKLKLRISTDFSTAEHTFIKDEISKALKFYSGDSYSLKITTISPSAIPAKASEVPEKQIIINRSKLFPRPAVQLNPRGLDPANSLNPNQIIGAIIHLDDFTLDQLFQNNGGSDEDIAFARSLLQRCAAGVLGWRPTTKLPGESIIDETPYPPEARILPGYSQYDRALAMAGSGGGTACYPAGMRFVRNKNKVILKADVNFPLNSGALIL